MTAPRGDAALQRAEVDLAPFTDLSSSSWVKSEHQTSTGPTQSQRLLFLAPLAASISEEDLGNVAMEKDSGADLETALLAPGGSSCFLCTRS